MATHYELHTGDVSGGFFAELESSGVCAGEWSPDAGHQLHALTAVDEGFVAIGISTESSVIMGVMMTIEQAEKHIQDVRRMLGIVRAGGGGTP